MAVDGTLPPVPENKVSATLRGIPGFYQAVVLEMRKVTWPAFVDVRRATVAIIIFVLLIGLFITILDKLLGSLLGNLIPSIFVGGR